MSGCQNHAWCEDSYKRVSRAELSSIKRQNSRPAERRRQSREAVLAWFQSPVDSQLVAVREILGVAAKQDYVLGLARSTEGGL